MKATTCMSTLATLVSKIESLTTYPDDQYAKAKTAALVHAAQELERLSEAEHSLPHIAPITTKLAQVKEGTKP